MSIQTLTPEVTTINPNPNPEVKRLRDLKEGVRDMIMLDPRIIIVEEGHNPRDYSLPENRAHLDELKASIKEVGTLQPLWVRFDPSRKAAILVDGECRLRANLELLEEGHEIKAVPTIQVSGGNEAERLVLALTANDGKRLSQWEMGTALWKLHNFGWSIESIAKKLGKSVRFINDAMELSNSPQEVKVLLSESAVTPALALAHVRKSGDQAGKTLKQAVDTAKAQGKKTATREKAESKIDRQLAAADALAVAIEDYYETDEAYGTCPNEIWAALKAYRTTV